MLNNVTMTVCSQLKSNLIRSPLRYPGGKYELMNTLLWYLPQNSKQLTLYEPFVGGGVYFLNTLDNFKYIHINDIDTRVYLFWKHLYDSPHELALEIRKIKPSKEFYSQVKNTDIEDSIEYTAKWFVMNRLAFNGNTATGGYSGPSRFTDKCIDYLEYIGDKIKSYNITITNDHYSKIFMTYNQNGFMYLDPPYSNTKNLYLDHNNFDHNLFRLVLSTIKIPWVLSYNEEESKNYSNYSVKSVKTLYNGQHIKRPEIIITNSNHF